MLKRCTVGLLAARMAIRKTNSGVIPQSGNSLLTTAGTND